MTTVHFHILKHSDLLHKLTIGFANCILLYSMFCPNNLMNYINFFSTLWGKERLEKEQTSDLESLWLQTNLTRKNPFFSFWKTVVLQFGIIKCASQKNPTSFSSVKISKIWDTSVKQGVSALCMSTGKIL